MLPRRPSTHPVPDDARAPAGAAEQASDSVPTLREILARYRQQGTAPGQLAAAAPAQPPAAAPKLASLRSLFLDSTSDPTLAPAARADAWTQPPPRRR